MGPESVVSVGPVLHGCACMGPGLVAGTELVGRPELVAGPELPRQDHK